MLVECIPAIPAAVHRDPMTHVQCRVTYAVDRRQQLAVAVAGVFACPALSAGARMVS